MVIDKCKKCGSCCNRNGIRCPYLTSDNLCSVYDNRPNWCLTVEQMKNNNILPIGCGYHKED